MAAESIRTLLMSCVAGENQTSVFAVLERKDTNEDNILNSNEDRNNQTQLTEGQIVGLHDSLGFHIYALSVNNLASFLSLLLPFIDYSFSTNIFKQLQRQRDVQ